MLIVKRLMLYYVDGQFRVTKVEQKHIEKEARKLAIFYRQRIEGLVEEAEKEAQEKMAEKYGTYNYDFMEGVFSLKFAISDYLEEKEKNA